MAQFYPTVYNNLDSYQLPALEVRGNDIYSTIYYEIHGYGLPTFEIR